MGFCLGVMSRLGGEQGLAVLISDWFLVLFGPILIRTFRVIFFRPLS